MIRMKSVGELLQDTRKNQKLSIKQVSAAIKIREGMIDALEKSDYSLFASDMHLKSFLKSYAKYLGINPEKIMAMYRRERQIESEDNPKGKKVNLNVNTKKQIFSLSRLFSVSSIITIIGLIVIVVIISFFVQFWLKINTPPNLEIISPDNNQIIETKSFIIEGRTDSNEVTVALDGNTANFYDVGRFRLNAEFDSPGYQRFLITATNRLDISTTITLELTYTPREEVTPSPTPSPEPTTTETPSPSVSPTPSPTELEGANVIRFANDSSVNTEFELRIDDQEGQFQSVILAPDESNEFQFNSTLEVQNFNNELIQVFLNTSEDPLEGVNTDNFNISINSQNQIIITR